MLSGCFLVVTVLFSFSGIKKYWCNFTWSWTWLSPW